MYHPFCLPGLTSQGPGVGGPYGPYVQSTRTSIYNRFADRLLSSHNAYRCFCSSERLHQATAHRHKMGLPPGYDRTCLQIKPEESDERARQGQHFVIRLKTPPILPSFSDLVVGIIRQPTKGAQRSHTGVYDDTILMKSDGQPTYHFANVVDDHLMKITHVIRGSEWLPSTPLHAAIYQAFGWEPPLFGHVSLLVDEHGDKLSKRDQRTNLDSYRGQAGVDPDVLLNFVALLGWSHQAKSDIMTLDEITKIFTPKFTRGNAMVTMAKLNYLQSSHIQRIIHESNSRPRSFEELNRKVSQAATDQYTQAQL